ncbi:MAG TPA: FtsX-like permease family protein, partial [Ktedonobacteraceae bacterium]|nr:FtsX-like permease family protein [Ktedonobacteraceae bacterium]
VNNQPISTLLPTGRGNPSATSLGRGGTLYFLSGIEGYDVGNNQFPSTQDIRIVAGRNLDASDAGTDHILIAFQLANLAPLHLKVGDTVMLAGLDRVTTRTVTVVGVYRPLSLESNIYPLLGTSDTAKALAPAGIDQSIFYMRIDPNKLNNAIDVIGNAVPNAFVLNLANISDIIDQLLSDVLLTLTTIASLSLLAGLIIIANAVALAMLERRRELGILKSVGYTSGSILSEVLIENGLVGGTGALLAMLLVTLATSLLGTYVFKSQFGVDGSVALELIVGSALLAMLTAALVAWGSVRVRPLEVLRYE